jgi:hypothetical protein
MDVGEIKRDKQIKIAFVFHYWDECKIACDKDRYLGMKSETWLHCIYENDRHFVAGDNEEDSDRV